MLLAISYAEVKGNYKKTTKEMELKEIKIHDCHNNTTIFNLLRWVSYGDYKRVVETQQKRIEELEGTIKDTSLVIDAFISTNQPATVTALENIKKDLNKNN